jgi:hypothetical protein
VSSPEPIGTLEATGMTSRRLSVEFYKTGDRYWHLIVAIDGNKRFPVLKSFEGEEGQVLPHIPCFQEFHQQGQTLFLTGATAVGHWSMSVQVGEAHPPEKENRDIEQQFMFKQRFGLNAPNKPMDGGAFFQFLSFEVACRVKQSVHHIGSEYLKAENYDCHVSGVSTSAMLASPDDDTPIIHLLGNDPFLKNLALSPNPDCSLVHADATNLRFFSPCDSPDELPATIQWRYGVLSM